jgi:hypothetical protein
MKSTFTNKLLFGLSLMLIGAFANAQERGLEKVIVEKYYVSNADDSIASDGKLPVGSVTYRIFVDMLEGYKFNTAYGNSTSEKHPLFIKTTTAFFNNEERGAKTPTYSKVNAKKGTLMLDSWVTAGAACTGNYGILKSEDDSVATVVNADGVLQNKDATAGIPLTLQDGLIAGTPGECAFISGNTDSIFAVFGDKSMVGNIFELTNGAWYYLGGVMGPKPSNRVLIAQVTTNGKMSFELNVTVQKKGARNEQYFVAKNPLKRGGSNDSIQEILDTTLTYVSPDPPKPKPNTLVAEKTSNVQVSVFPNPATDKVSLNINAVNSNSNNYYTIYNILGNVVLTKKIENTSGNKYNNTIDVSGYSNGVFFVEVSVNGVKSIHKLIKK